MWGGNLTQGLILQGFGWLVGWLVHLGGPSGSPSPLPQRSPGLCPGMVDRSAPPLEFFWEEGRCGGTCWKATAHPRRIRMAEEACKEPRQCLQVAEASPVQSQKRAGEVSKGRGAGEEQGKGVGEGAKVWGSPPPPSTRLLFLLAVGAALHLLVVAAEVPLPAVPGEDCWLQSQPAAVVEGLAAGGAASVLWAESCGRLNSASCPSAPLTPTTLPGAPPGSGVLGACSVGVAACIIFCLTSRILSCKQTLVGKMSE